MRHHPLPVILVLTLSASQVRALAPQAKAPSGKPKASATRKESARERVILRSTTPGQTVGLAREAKTWAARDKAAKKGEESLAAFDREAEAAGDWHAVVSFTPAALLSEKAARAKADRPLIEVEVLDGPDRGLRGWVAKGDVLRGEKGMSLERKLDLEKTVARNRAKKAEQALARARQKAREIGDDEERRAYLEKMRPALEAQARQNALLQQQAQRIAIEAELARERARALEMQSGGPRRGADVPYPGGYGTP